MAAGRRRAWRAAWRPSCPRLPRRAAVGYGPKMLERVLRFQRARRIARGTTSLALVAALAGYADQAHLSRECRSARAERLTVFAPGAGMSLTRASAGSPRLGTSADRRRAFPSCWRMP